ncbi:MAG TPA: putative Na+/H+ antiporter [Verrucomicrobiae bacterium]
MACSAFGSVPLFAADAVTGDASQSFSTSFNSAATLIFGLAILHTFVAPRLMKLSHRLEQEHTESISRSGTAVEQAELASARGPVSFKAELLHFLGEIEVVFGLWVIPLFATMVWFHGWPASVAYLESRNFIEPLFVLVIMTIAATRPVMVCAQAAMATFAKLGKNSAGAWWFAILTVGPLLGSFITEPAAMTISALLLGTRFFAHKPSSKLAYGTLGLLFVNISIGGTLTHFAAPPVLMVASKWGWNTPFMAANFGWKAIIAILLSNIVFWIFFRREFSSLQGLPAHTPASETRRRTPKRIIFIHVLFLGWTVFTNHYPILFVGGFLFFLGFVKATSHHQDDVSLRTPLLVAFFLAGLVIHGGLQGWWIEPLIRRLAEKPLFFGSIVLTAFNDNAAITYLASLVPDLADNLKYAVVAGAVVGGGLTVIANAPNPAGVSLLSRYFGGAVSPLGLLLGAAVPTTIAAICFLIL